MKLVDFQQVSLSGSYIHEIYVNTAFVVSIDVGSPVSINVGGPVNIDAGGPVSIDAGSSVSETRQATTILHMNGGAYNASNLQVLGSIDEVVAKLRGE